MPCARSHLDLHECSSPLAVFNTGRRICQPYPYSIVLKSVDARFSRTFCAFSRKDGILFFCRRCDFFAPSVSAVAGWLSMPVFCCTARTPYRPIRTDQEDKFSTFLSWADGPCSCKFVRRSWLRDSGRQAGQFWPGPAGHLFSAHCKRLQRGIRRGCNPSKAAQDKCVQKLCTLHTTSSLK